MVKREDIIQLLQDEINTSTSRQGEAALEWALKKVEQLYERVQRDEDAKKVRTMCKCGQRIVPEKVDNVSWYWQLHGRDECTLELPNIKCWCGLLRHEHLLGHREGVKP